jgi:hypothetical protein
MTTLESLVNRRMEAFDVLKSKEKSLQSKVEQAEKALESVVKRGENFDNIQAARDELRLAAENLKASQRAEEDKIDYLLRAAPYIEKYMHAACEKQRHVPNSCIPPPSARNLHGFVEISGVSRHNDIYMQYLEDVEKMYVRRGDATSDNDDVCVQCGERVFFDTTESCLVCKGCGVSRQYTEGSCRNMNYDEEVEHKCTRTPFSYKRLTHWLEFLSSLQGKENTSIPQDVIDAVKSEFKKHRLVAKKDITPAKVKVFLKKLGHSKFYEHRYFIANVINGVPSTALPEHLEHTLKKMFLRIQTPFEKHCPAERKNFLSYSYTLYKCLELLGEDKYLHLCNLLRGRDKLAAQDVIWKRITESLRWEFIPTV